LRSLGSLRKLPLFWLLAELRGIFANCMLWPKEFGLPAPMDPLPMTRPIVPCSLYSLLAIASCLAVFAGCNASSSTLPTKPIATSGTGATAPGDDDLLKQIDDALEHTYEHRRLSVGTTDQNQAAWQIIHGALAFKREFQVSDGEKDV